MVGPQLGQRMRLTALASPTLSTCRIFRQQHRRPEHIMLNDKELCSRCELRGLYYLHVGRASRGMTATAAAATTTASPTTAADHTATAKWLKEKSVSLAAFKLERSQDGTVWTSAARSIAADEVILQVPGDMCVTAADVAADTTVAAVAEGRSELTGLALWIIAQRLQGNQSSWAPLLKALPAVVETPLLWSEEQRAELLRGSPVAQQSRERAQQLKEEWASIAEAAPNLPSGFDESSFLAAMTVALAHAVYIPAASCFALAPGLSALRRSGSSSAASVGYDADASALTLSAGGGYSVGDEVAIYDPRPNGELCMSTGSVQAKNPSDFLTTEASLVASDRLYSIKKEVLDGVGFETPQDFPITVDGMPLQLLAYLRMARIVESAEFTRVNFEEDVIISPNNEYEVLQLLLADCRDRFTAYGDNMESDTKLLQQKELSKAERLAAQLRLEEKRIVTGFMDAVRERLAPIRGIPTKSGAMSDPNQDVRDIFEAFESIPNIPAKIFGGFRSWARGENDPTWKKKGGKDTKRPW